MNSWSDEINYEVTHSLSIVHSFIHSYTFYWALNMCKILFLCSADNNSSCFHEVSILMKIGKTQAILKH